MKLSRSVSVLLGCLILLGLQACSQKEEETKTRRFGGLRVYKVSATAESRVRRFPSILQPADVSPWRSRLTGQLKAISLEAGQKVQLGDLLAEIDPRSLQAQVEQATAGVEQAEAQSGNAEPTSSEGRTLQGDHHPGGVRPSKAALLTARAHATRPGANWNLPGTIWTAANSLPRFQGPSPAST